MNWRKVTGFFSDHWGKIRVVNFNSDFDDLFMDEMKNQSAAAARRNL